MCVARFPSEVVRTLRVRLLSSVSPVACVVFQAEQTAFFSPKPRSRRLGRLRAHHREARGAFRRPQPRETGPEGESPIELYSRRTKKKVVAIPAPVVPGPQTSERFFPPPPASGRPFPTPWVAVRQLGHLWWPQTPQVWAPTLPTMPSPRHSSAARRKRFVVLLYQTRTLALPLPLQECLVMMGTGA